MLEKLLENWLDSASERSYQPAFVQMLTSQGYRVVHSTRHSALEFGKDVLAVGPDGVGCAYQLKGNPGGKLGLAEFRRIQPQLVQLMSQAIVYPGFPEGRHRSFLVTNGFFDEEVQRAADDLNRMRYPSQVSLISRGDLLAWARQLGESLWPSELDDTQRLLQLFLADPKDLLATAVLAPLVGKIVGLDGRTKRFKREQMDRAIPAAALLVGISIGRFASAENHLAVAWAWTLFAVSAIGGLERNRMALRGTSAKSIELAEHAISDALAALWREIAARAHLVEGDPFTDPEIYQWRLLVLVGAMSCLALRHESNPILLPTEYEELKTWLLRPDIRILIWGEAAIASVVPWLVWSQQHDATLRSDMQIAAAARFVINSNQAKSGNVLANPYSSFEEIFRQQLPFGKPTKLREQLAGNSHTALLLFHLLTRTNLKQQCLLLWSDLTRLHHRTSIPDTCWEYCKVEMEHGTDETCLLPLEYAWSTLRADARKDCSHALPEGLLKRPWLLALWWQVCPPRLTPDSCRAFASAVLPDWGT